MANALDDNFTAREVVAVLSSAGLNFDYNNLRDWHRRGILPAAPAGKGAIRYYPTAEVIRIAALAFLAPHMRYGQLTEAARLADQLADAISRIIDAGLAEGFGWDNPCHVLVHQGGSATFLEVNPKTPFLSVARDSGWRGAVVVNLRQMAVGLSAALHAVLSGREMAVGAQRDRAV